MKLYEIFDKIAPYKKTWESDDILDYEFIINNTKFETSFYKPEPNDPWNITFSDLDAEIQNAQNDEESGMGMTNKGNAFQVMSTVIAIIKEFLKLKKPTEIVFSSSNDSRTKLYLRLTKLLQQAGWKLYTEKDDADGYTHFYLQFNS